MDEDSKLNMIETEYSLYEPEENAVSLNDVFIKIYVTIAEAEGRREKLFEEDNENEVRLNFLRRWGERLGRLMGIPREGIVLIDIGYVGDLESMVDRYLDQLTSSLRVVDEENYSEVNKLVSFARDKYFRNCESVQELRRISEAKDRGEEVERTYPDENSSSVNDFVESHLETLMVDAIVRNKEAVKSKLADKARYFVSSKNGQ